MKVELQMSEEQHLNFDIDGMEEPSADQRETSFRHNPIVGSNHSINNNNNNNRNNNNNNYFHHNEFGRSSTASNSSLMNEDSSSGLNGRQYYHSEDSKKKRPLSHRFYRFIHSVDPPLPTMTRPAAHLLSPITKWRLYAIVPVKFIAHLLLLAVVITQVFLRDPYASGVIRNSRDTWRYFFLPNGQWRDGQWTQDFFTTEGVRDQIIATSMNYFSLPQQSVDLVEIYNASAPRHHFVDAPWIALTRYQDDGLNTTSLARIFSYSFTKTTTTEVYPLNISSPAGPLTALSGVDLKAKGLAILAELRTEYYLRVIDPTTPSCYAWSITVTYDFSSRGGRTVGMMRPSSSICTASDTLFVTQKAGMLALTLVSILLSVVVMILGARALMRSVQLHHIAHLAMDAALDDERKEAEAKGESTPRQASSSVSNPTVLFRIGLAFGKAFQSFRHALRFIRPSDVNFLACGVLLLLFSFLSLFSDMSNAVLDILLGGVAFLACVQLVIYHNFFPQFFLLNTVLEKAFPQIIRMIAGVLPIYLAYLFGTSSMFAGYSPQFKTTSEVSYMLFGYINGDNVIATLSAVSAASSILSFIARLLVVSMFVFFAYSMIQCMVVILEEAHRLLLSKAPPPLQAPPDPIASLLMEHIDDDEPAAAARAILPIGKDRDLEAAQVARLREEKEHREREEREREEKERQWEERYRAGTIALGSSPVAIGKSNLARRLPTRQTVSGFSGESEHFHLRHHN